MDIYYIEHARKINETDLAIFFDIDGDAHWIPKSQILEIKEYPGIPVYCDLEIPLWFAEENL